jgi:hypothetical protein
LIPLRLALRLADRLVRRTIRRLESVEARLAMAQSRAEAADRAREYALRRVVAEVREASGTGATCPYCGKRVRRCAAGCDEALIRKGDAIDCLRIAGAHVHTRCNDGRWARATEASDG